MGGLSKLIPKPCELLKVIVIVTLRLEIEIKNGLCVTIQELPVTIEDIKSIQRFLYSLFDCTPNYRIISSVI